MKEVGVNKASKILRRRLEMMDIGNNMGRGIKCKCGEKETTEHVIQCEEIKKIMEKRTKIEWLKETANIKIIEEVTEWVVNYIEIREKNGQGGNVKSNEEVEDSRLR